MMARMKPNYTVGVETIALNDESSILDVEEMVGFASVMTLAAAFNVDQERVAADVVHFRRNHPECFGGA